MTLTAQEYWGEGNMRFNCWRIDGEQGNVLFQSSDLTLGVTEEISNLLADGEGRARELKCVYTPS